MKSFSCLAWVTVANLVFIAGTSVFAQGVVADPLDGVVGEATPSDVVQSKNFSSASGKGLTGTLKVTEKSIVSNIIGPVLLMAKNPVSSSVLFQENFDSLDDWATQSSGEIGTLPPGFDYGYTEETYHPETYTGSQPSIFISGADSSQVYGGVGKALIATYETTDSPGIYTSDGFLSKDIAPSDRVYVSFRVKFQPGFNAEHVNGSIKLFRILSYDGTGSRSAFFSSGNSAPIYLFDWSVSDYGVRQKHAFRCDDQASTYFCTDPTIKDPPRGISNGDMSANFTNDVATLNPMLIDQESSEVIPSSGTVWHEQVYGDTWHKLAFYVELNSAPSIQDGVLMFWLDDKLLIDMKQIPWIGRNGSMDAKWNNVSFGGNGKYHWDTSSGYQPSKERWVAIDDVLILNRWRRI